MWNTSYVSLSRSSAYELSTFSMPRPVNANIASAKASELNFMYQSSSTQELILRYNNIRTYIWTYVPPVILTIGIPCNLLALVVWIQSLVKKRGSSSSYFFACLALADIIALISQPMFHHIGAAYYDGADLRKLSNFNCKFHSFMVAFSFSFTSYILAALAVFRMVGALYPHQYKQICSTRNAKMIILFIIVFTVLAHIQIIFRYRLLNSHERGPACHDPATNPIVRLFLTIWMMLVLYIVPMFTVVLSNACIIWKLIRKRMHSIGTGRASRGDHAFAGTITVLIAVSLVYVVTISPVWVYVVLHLRTKLIGAMDRVVLARYQLSWAIVTNISLLNSMGNFFTYCVTHRQFVPEVKACFQAFSAQIRSRFPGCKKRNAVGIEIHVKEIDHGTASTSQAEGHSG